MPQIIEQHRNTTTKTLEKNIQMSCKKAKQPVETTLN